MKDYILYDLMTLFASSYIEFNFPLAMIFLRDGM